GQRSRHQAAGRIRGHCAGHQRRHYRRSVSCRRYRSPIISFISKESLSAVAQTIAQEVFEVGDFVNLPNGGVDVVLDAAILDRVVIEQHVTSTPIAVAWLTDGADVAQGLSTVELINVIDLVGTVELEAVGEDAGDVRMPLEAVAINQREDAFHLALIINVFREDVFV